MGPDTAPAKRLHKIGHCNVLVDCLMKVPTGCVPENVAGNKGGGRELAVSKALQRNTSREVQTVRRKETASRRMGYENLQWRRKPIANTVTKARQGLLKDWTVRVKEFGTGSTISMTTSESSWTLERKISHTSTRVSTSADLAVRKIKGGRVRAMKVLAHMSTT